MGKHKSNILTAAKVVLFLSLIFLIFNYLSNVFNVDPDSDYDLKDDYFLEEVDKDYADVLFVGASQTGRSISPTTMFDQSGYSSYVYSTAGMPIFPYYHKIKELVEDGYKPELVVLDISSIMDEYYFNDPEENEDRFRTGIYTLNSVESKIDYALNMEENYEGDYFTSYLFPLFSFHENWQDVNINEDALLLGEAEFAYWGMGANISGKLEQTKSIKEGNIIESNTDMDPIDPIAEEYFIKTVELLEENDIDVLAIKYLDSVTDSGIHNSLQNLCDENNVDFLNLNLDENKNILKSEYGLDYDKHFYNYKHTNASGMVISTSFVTDYLAKEYDLEDHREDEDYQFMFDYHDIFVEEYPEAFE